MTGHGCPVRRRGYLQHERPICGDVARRAGALSARHARRCSARELKRQRRTNRYVGILGVTRVGERSYGGDGADDC